MFFLVSSKFLAMRNIALYSVLPWHALAAIKFLSLQTCFLLKLHTGEAFFGLWNYEVVECFFLSQNPTGKFGEPDYLEVSPCLFIHILYQVYPDQNFIQIKSE